MSTENEIQDQEVEVTLDDLTFYWSTDGIPVVVADRPDIVDIVISLGFSIFYVMGDLESEIKPAPKPSASKTYSSTGTTTTYATTPPAPVYAYNTAFFKVVSNFIGTSVSLAQNVQIQDMHVVKNYCYYDMPKIPRVIIDKLDQFFRSVEKIHNSEAIVLLTFDTTKTDSSGWGILVPDQENNAAHCNYDPLSVADEKPDHVMIVGSVHSHPSMAAYASGTDHSDQASFDGLHITFGWQSTVNNNATQYHIEMQMSGNSYTLTPDQVFESDPSFDPDPEVLLWVDKVKKAQPPSWGGPASNQYRPLTTLNPGHTQTKTHSQQKDSSSKTKSSFGAVGGTQHYSEILPSYSLDSIGIVVAEVVDVSLYTDAIEHCPVCDHQITIDDIYNCFCSSCDIPFATCGTNAYEVVDELKTYCSDRLINFYDYAVYLWGFDFDGTSWMIKLFDPISSIDNPNFSTSTALNYDEIMSSVNLYKYNSRCEDCKNCYTFKCPAYSKLYDEYTLNKLDLNNIEYTVDGEGCSSYEYYHGSNLESTYYYD